MINKNRIRNRGFTIIELIMVIVIIGILAIVALPRFEVIADIKLRTAAKRLTSDIRYVQSVAITRRADTRIVFNAGAESYQAQTNETGAWTALTDPFTRTDLSVDFDDGRYAGVDIVSSGFGGTNILIFDWQGIPYDSGHTALTSDGTVALRCRGIDLDVKVTAQTGKVDIILQ